MSDTKLRQLKSGVNRHHRAGFTLVEMLVATGLVVLIMSFFAQIYGTAISTMTEQKGIGNNDQRARVLNDLIRNDLKYMSYKQVDSAHGSTPGIVPITPGDGPILDLDNQKGYFFLSENDPYDPTDDVLQFTIAIDTDAFDDYRVGKAADLGSFRNQPLYDGGPQSAPGQSRFAEVAYFLRKGVLYRHVLLLRDVDGVDEQPGNGETDRRFGFAGVDVQGGASRPDYTGGIFYRDFDYSATRRFVGAESGGVVTDVGSSLWFHGAQSLMNGGDGRSVNSLGLPWNRFGHHIDLGFKADGRLHNGMPREFTLPNADGEFIGRFTHWETSSDEMTFPGTYDPSNSIVRRDLALRFNSTTGQLESADGTTIISSGYRVGEDVVLTNVESFDVEVWDPTFGGFLPLGHRNSSGREFSTNQNIRNTNYGPRGSGNVIFDTWHTDATIGTARPPYRPVRFELDADLPENQPIHSTRRGASYDEDDVTDGTVIAIPALRQTINDDYWSEDPPSTPPTVRNSNSWVYQLIQGGTTDPAPAPDFPPILGNVVTDGTTLWKCIDNRIGLSAIRITIRYVDPQTHLSRQLTIVHSFAK